jgi:hypothetical protein
MKCGQTGIAQNDARISVNPRLRKAEARRSEHSKLFIVLAFSGFSRREKGMLSYKLSRLQPGFSTRFSKGGAKHRAEACREAALKRAMPRGEG